MSRRNRGAQQGPREPSDGTAPPKTRTPKQPDAAPRDEGAVSILLPVARTGHRVPRRIDRRLTATQAQALRDIYDGARREGAQLVNGRDIESVPDALGWMLEQVAGPGSLAAGPNLKPQCVEYLDQHARPDVTITPEKPVDGLGVAVDAFVLSQPIAGVTELLEAVVDHLPDVLHGGDCSVHRWYSSGNLGGVPDWTPPRRFSPRRAA